MRNAKEEYISNKCSSTEANLSKNYSKKPYLTSSKQKGNTVIQDKNGSVWQKKVIYWKDGQKIVQNCINFKTNGYENFTHAHESTDFDSYYILRKEVVAAVRDLKKGKSAGFDNIPGELGQAGGDAHNLQQGIDYSGMAQGMNIIIFNKSAHSCYVSKPF